MIEVYKGNIKDITNKFPDNYFQSIITSPPYYLQRDYGNDEQIGLEKTSVEFVDNLVNIFINLRPKMKDDGLIFVNIDDSYSGSGKGNKSVEPFRKRRDSIDGIDKKALVRKADEVKRKSLFGVPYRFALRMIENDFILRNDIIWHKPNAVPDSVKDRFTRDYEHIFMFAISDFYKFNLLKEKSKIEPIEIHKKVQFTKKKIVKENLVNDETTRHIRCVWDFGVNANNRTEHTATYPVKLVERLLECSCDAGDVVLDPFCGTGSTLFAAETLGINSIGVDLTPIELDKYIVNDMCNFDERQSELYNKMISKKGKVIANAQF